MIERTTGKFRLDVIVLAENEVVDENGELKKVDHDKDPSVIFVQYPSTL